MEKNDYPRIGHLVDAGASGHPTDAADAVDLPFGRLLVVAEGMGPEDAHNEPASIVVDALSRHLQEAAVDVSAPDDLRTHLKAAMAAANRQLLGAGKVSRTLSGAVVSVVATLLVEDRAYVACAGVARLYLVREGKATRVTRFDDEESGGAPPKPLGLDQSVEPLVLASSISFQSGDALVLCSGGLYDVVERKEIAHESLAYPAEVSAIKLMEMARQRDATRSIAVVVYQSSAPHLKKSVEAHKPVVASPRKDGEVGARLAGYSVLALVAVLVAGAVYGAFHLYRAWDQKPGEEIAVAEPAPTTDVKPEPPKPEPLKTDGLKEDPNSATEEILKQAVVRREREKAVEEAKAEEMAAKAAAAMAEERAREESDATSGEGPAQDPDEAADHSGQTEKLPSGPALAERVAVAGPDGGAENKSEEAAAKKAAAEKAAAETAAAEKVAAEKVAAEKAAAEKVAAEKAAAEKVAAEKAAAEKAAAEKAAAEKAAAEKAAAEKAAAEKAAAEKAAAVKAAAEKLAAEKAGQSAQERCSDDGLSGDDRVRVRIVRKHLDKGFDDLKHRKGAEAGQSWKTIRIKMKHGSANVQAICGPAVEEFTVALYREYLRLAKFFDERKRCGPALARAGDARYFLAPEEEVKATLLECYKPPK